LLIRRCRDCRICQDHGRTLPAGSIHRPRERLLDPEAFVISSAMLKTHNTAIATLSIKNMVLGAPLQFAPNETPHWNEKRKFHVGLRQTHDNMLLTAQATEPVIGRC
jgi:hypothetical protein